MDTLFGAVLTQLPEPEKNLIASWLQVQGLVVKECTSKNWKDYQDSIRLFTKPSPDLAKELLEWSIEPILCGNFTNAEKEIYKEVGVTLLWEKPYTEIHTLPYKTLPLSKLTWVIYTKDPIFDKHLSVFLKTMGQTVFAEGNLEFLLKRIQTGPCHFLILDWDVVNDPRTFVLEISKLKKAKQFLSIGIKDFMKENLYRDLKTGIGTISEVLVAKLDFWNVLVHSFPLREEEDTNDWKESSQSISKLSFSFQEKQIPISMQLTETTMIKKKLIHPQVENLLGLFGWFL
ncbi:hypothetical protein ND861_17710 [Leptospira sp. 2 VSF19]|uniref:Uncharacterized protein n=1 Tax=Leptospira soteropolitanensis TaxID=2950025 RepID=A0AAW5VP19_9LEPT|nr:hypothetical protein [Leptospira soteropolitanensis]MCW7494487.1 hypothetical protein [Leptospira soteropolitanensis]MCW7502081.1 hypothetical protein [Leptospira soteropolitanensis]MCW7524333.1 hypothetical protein [Leptospira soteropolitanensis]MCW7528198.1 hypothetical protein [Leptospira soteropolitanensis]MCW7532051.1 hypothetical protein [Leptospira soteropolitanensis]